MQKETVGGELTIQELCRWIEMPQEMAEWVRETDEEFGYDKIEKEWDMLLHEQTRQEGLEKLRKVLGRDEKGVRMLTCMLHGAIASYREYQKRGIPQDIYIATMKCFTRFVGEHMESYGCYGFDRDFWTPRQIALKLFRVGELEYELWNWQGKEAVSIHIPSDAAITPDRVTQSLKQAVSFMEKYYPAYVGVPYTCDSWLLSPGLKELLAPDSNIIRFQERFHIEEINPDAPDVLEWVFKNPKCALEDLPENTSLQRKMKEVLLRGGKMGIAFGVLCD